MRFVCDSCRAQYMINDDKVGAKGVKVRCKKCGYVILVRRPDPEAAISNEGQYQPQMANEAEAGRRPDEDEEPTNPGYLAQSNAPGKSVLDGLADDEIGAAFDQALSPGSSPPREDESAEGSPLEPVRDRALDMDGSAALKLFEQSVAAVQPAAAVETAQNGAAHEWFVAINEQQVGPYGFDKVKHLWDRGEIGPDTLCWRAGLSDWVSLSETPELASLLAPKPARPVIVAPTSAVGGGAPVESVFSSGSKAARAEALPAAGGTEQSGGWKPSAATALASLMKEEIEVLAKAPAPAPVAEPVGPASRLLDVPAAQSNGRTVSSPSLRVSTGDSNAARAPAASALAEPTYPSLYAGYPPKSSKKMILFLSVGAGLLLLALAVVTTILITKPAEPSGEVVAAKPKGSGGKTAAAPSQSEQEPKKEAAAATKVDSSAVAKTEPSRSPTETATPAKADAPPKVDAPPPISRTERPSRRERGARSSSHGGEEISVPAVKRSERPEVVARGGRSSSEDDFDREFGGERKGGAAKAEPPARRSSSVYVPPEPGAEIPDSLGQSDIMQVVVANKPAILRCVTEQKKKDSNLSGRLVMRWTILASGKTTNISCQSDEFRSSYMAQCLSGLIRGWQFPRHKVQGEAINFPFTF